MDGVAMAFKGYLSFMVGGLPQANGAIGRTTGDYMTAGVPGNSIYSMLMRPNAQGMAPIDTMKQSDLTVCLGAGDQLSIGAPIDTIEYLLDRGRFEQQHTIVHAAHGHAAIGAYTGKPARISWLPCHGMDGLMMILVAEVRLALSWLP
jgi:hypothetical protein